ncbi:MAG: DUF4013 domain-containing protein [Vampirovibrionia bacterium]
MIFDPRKSILAPLKAYRNNKLLSIYITAWVLILFKTLILGLAIFSTQAIANAVDMNLPSEQVLSTHINTMILALKIVTWVSYIFFSSFVFGYILKTAKNEMSNPLYTMPSWEGNYADIFYKGLNAIIITAIYLSPLGLILWLETVNRGSFILANYLNIFSENILDEPYKIIFILYVLSMLLIIPSAIISFTEKNNILYAFHLPKIILKLTSNGAYYIAAYVFSLLLIILTVVLSTIISTTCLGILFIPLLIEFIVPIIIFNMLTQAYKIKTEEVY